MKECKDCGINKSLSEFGKKKTAKDGHRGNCKICHAEYDKEYYKKNKESILSRHKTHSSQPHIKAARKAYTQTEDAKILIAKVERKSWAKYPNARKSRKYYFYNKHKLTPLEHCDHCNIKPEVIQAHHDDYNKPLQVIYLCIPCHIAEHKINTPLNRVSGIFTERNQ